MSVTREDVEKVAVLARLKLSEKEIEEMTSQLNEILEYFEKLKELDTEGVEPLSHVLPLKNVYREDRVKPSLSQEDLLSNAPEKGHGHFKVPRVIE